MDFFKALRRASNVRINKSLIRADIIESNAPEAFDPSMFTEFPSQRWAVAGQGATIKALKEMMVGEPKRARLRHRGRISTTPYTVVEFRPGRHFGIGGLEHIRTDGEEVVVMVFRYEEVNQNLTNQ